MNLCTKNRFPLDSYIDRENEANDRYSMIFRRFRLSFFAKLKKEDIFFTLVNRIDLFMNTINNNEKIG